MGMEGLLDIQDIEKIEDLAPFDIYFSRFIAGLDDQIVPAVQLAATMLSRVIRSGDTCLDLELAAGRSIGADTGYVRTPSLETWIPLLRKSRAVGQPGQIHPLILDSSHRLYLYRYWQYERRLVDNISGRISQSFSDIPATDFKCALDRYFPPISGKPFDWQKLAVVIALLSHFSIITGGPGTGKTFTIARLLALYCDLNQSHAPRIHLSAPTGKAAAKLRSSVMAAKSHLDLTDNTHACIPDEVFTLHRLLKSIPGSSVFYYNAENHLPTDLLVIDEASMVDLALMSKVVSALPSGARLILAGDRDQLASVEAGSVFGDMCGVLDKPRYSRRLGPIYHQLTGEQLPSGIADGENRSGPMGDTIALLHHNYRFESSSGLGALSRAVRAGNAEDAIDLLTDAGEPDLNWVDLHEHEEDHLYHLLAEALTESLESYLKSNSAMAALAAMQHFQILTALRKGPYGADGINGLVESVLVNRGLIQPDLYGGIHYHGRPVMINRNDYDIQLFNGDLGVVWNNEGHSGDEANVYFTAPDGGLRKIWPHRLPTHETVFAMTVHKSQGSEFDHVMLILPQRDNELLTRELIYTALTRARRQVTVWASRAVLEKALSRRLERRSGLRDALWPDTEYGEG